MGRVRIICLLSYANGQGNDKEEGEAGGWRQHVYSDTSGISVILYGVIFQKRELLKAFSICGMWCFVHCCRFLPGCRLTAETQSASQPLKSYRSCTVAETSVLHIAENPCEAVW
jgi:hypothetical protein